MKSCQFVTEYDLNCMRYIKGITMKGTVQIANFVMLLLFYSTANAVLIQRDLVSGSGDGLVTFDT